MLLYVAEPLDEVKNSKGNVHYNIHTWLRRWFCGHLLASTSWVRFLYGIWSCKRRESRLGRVGNMCGVDLGCRVGVGDVIRLWI